MPVARPAPKKNARSRDDAAGEDPRLEHGWRMVDAARELFARALPQEVLPRTWHDPRRVFTVVDYLALLLIGLFNPTVRSLRGLCAASALPRLQAQWGCGRLPLASTSDAQHLVDPERLRPLIAQLSAKVQSAAAQAGTIPDPAGARARMGRFALRVIDSTLIEALPRMAWAAYGGGRPRADGRRHTAVRFHLSFDPLAPCPSDYTVTPGKGCERAAWRAALRAAPLVDPGAPAAERTELAIGDRYYGGSYTLLETFAREGTHYLVRLRGLEHPVVLEELALTDADRAAGVLRQAWVWLGKAPKKATAPRVPVRVIWLQGPQDVIVLATDHPPELLDAALAAQMYRERWQVEFFFRWIKCLLGCGHWLAESRQGATLQLYLVLIAALLLQLQCGRRPTRRMMELLHFYFQGHASVKDLQEGLERAAREAALAAASAKARAQKKAAQKV